MVPPQAPQEQLVLQSWVCVHTPHDLEVPAVHSGFLSHGPSSQSVPAALHPKGQLVEVGVTQVPLLLHRYAAVFTEFRHA